MTVLHTRAVSIKSVFRYWIDLFIVFSTSVVLCRKETHSYGSFVRRFVSNHLLCSICWQRPSELPCKDSNLIGGCVSLNINHLKQPGEDSSTLLWLVNFVNRPAVMPLCRCHTCSNGVRRSLEMKLLKPHSKCYIMCSANYTDEFQRHFWSASLTLPCLTSPSLRIISLLPICILSAEWI